MIKDTQDAPPITIEDSATATQHADLFASFLAQPVSKLHADEYTVDDLDGVTESLFGSGNMNFLMMQAGQTDEALINATPFDQVGGNDYINGSAIPVLSGASAVAYSAGEGLATMDAQDRALGGEALAAPGSVYGSNAASAIGSLGAPSSASMNTAASTPFSSVQSYSASSSADNNTNLTNTGTNGTNGVDGSSGTNGTNGTDGGGDGDTTIINNNTTNNNYDIDIVDIDIDDSLTEIVNHTTDFLTELVENTFNTVNNTINNIFDIIDGDGLGPIGLDLAVTLDDLTELTLDIFNGNLTIPVLDQVLDLTPVTNLTDALADLTGSLGLHLLYDPLNPDTSAGDTDITLLTDLNLPLLNLPGLDLDIPLDPIEALLGDIDLDLGVANDLLVGLLGNGGAEADHDLGINLGSAIGGVPLINDGAAILLNPVEDLLGDIDIGLTPNLDLFDTSAISNEGGDTDITIPLDIDLLGTGLLAEGLDIPLDPVEAILGDIDLDLTVATDLLGQMAAGLIDSEDGGSAAPNLLSDIGDSVANLLAPLAPETDGHVVSNLIDPLLNPAQDLVGNLLGNGGSEADHDLGINLGSAIGGIPLINDGTAILLNPVEDLVGDIDIGITPNIDLFDTSAISNEGGDADITVPLDIDLLGTGLFAEGLDIPLDPVEAILGDIDLDLTVATDLLGAVAAGLIDTEDGGSANPNLLSDIGDTIADLVSPLVPEADGHVISNLLDPLLNPVQDLVGDTSLLDITGILNVSGDGDTGLPFDIDFIDNPLDLVEGLAGGLNLGDSGQTGDNFLSSIGDTLSDQFGSITAEIGNALEFLNNSSSGSGDLNLGALGGLGDAADIPLWTESLLPNAIDSLGSGLGGDISHILPDPVIFAPIVASIAPQAIHDLLGGGKSFGGLFG